MLATVTHFLPVTSREVAVELAADASHMTAVWRLPAGDWQPDNTPDELTQFVFLVDGNLACGTIVDYARHWESAHYSGDCISPEVRTWTAAFTVCVERVPVTGDRVRYRLSVGTQRAWVTLDARS
ncbi:hypothetical protein SCATT_05900 [Streptantibioticus cattleyicolor NRRL 8057 = DSM 46488]|uniref:Uncharacterized protein n=1 Tax=Streptantibioticus cattleyicolor (strain ATCC 35852 / DSM 46488 / JCM 4925 / NBRC 14057 / NRRL 8057) TaxID=1003195 RepID=G8WRE4_STREN|nr:hypothetical protein SCATT_05900 [Streptantibioticus cattleyicolor NRRL 8057 = DSM 46488]